MSPSLPPTNLPILRRLPLFSVEQRDTKGDKTVWSGRLARVGSPKPGGYLVSEEGGVVRGDWMEVEEDKTRGRFQVGEVVRGEAAVDVWRCISEGYWDERVELILARHTWTVQEFRAGDCVSYPGDGGKPTVVPGGWDHEHCAICWEKIGSGGQQRGYENDGDWICAACHDQYAVPVSLGFLDSDHVIEQAGGLV